MIKIYTFTQAIRRCCLALAWLSTATCTVALSETLDTAPGANVTPWLAAADAFVAAPDARIYTEVKVYSKGVLERERAYQTYSSAKKRLFLTLFKHPSENGQKMLIKGHNFWLFLPRSRRATRITAQQKLLGDAAIGDIATIRWSDDYKGQLISCDATTCLLKLQKKRRGATYSAIDLWLRKSNALPVKSALYLQSGRIAKTATYHSEKVDGQYQLRKTIFYNKIGKQQETHMVIKENIAFKAPSKWFNPAFVAKNKDFVK